VVVDVVVVDVVVVDVLGGEIALEEFGSRMPVVGDGVAVGKFALPQAPRTEVATIPRVTKVAALLCEDPSSVVVVSMRLLTKTMPWRRRRVRLFPTTAGSVGPLVMATRSL
jgi:hypothetical protein